MSAKSWADNFTNVGVNIRTDDSQYIFANSGLNVVANFGMNCRAIIFTDRCMGIRVYIRMHFGTDIFPDGWTNFRAANFWPRNFRANGNGGERIAAKNI